MLVCVFGFLCVPCIFMRSTFMHLNLLHEIAKFEYLYRSFIIVIIIVIVIAFVLT